MSSRSSDVGVLRRCAKAISNLSLFGGAENQEEMASHNVPEWLFPLAFMEDDNIRYEMFQVDTITTLTM
jgi:hypothetical protein